VEPAGVEPASKRGSNTLSTCLSSPSFFVYRQDRSHQPLPYPLNLIERTRLRPTIPDLAAPPDQRASRPRHLGDVSSRHYRRDKASIYYTSIKQQERSYFRQLQFWASRFTSRHLRARHAYIPLLPAVKTKRPRFLMHNWQVTN